MVNILHVPVRYDCFKFNKLSVRDLCRHVPRMQGTVIGNSINDGMNESATRVSEKPKKPSFGLLNPDLDRTASWASVFRARICKPVKETRNRFPAWRAGSVQPYLSYRPPRLHRLEESIPGLLKRLQIRDQLHISEYGFASQNTGVLCAHVCVCVCVCVLCALHTLCHLLIDKPLSLIHP